MEQLKYQFVVLLIAVGIGVMGGNYFTSKHYENEIAKITEEKVKSIQLEVDKERLKRVDLDKQITLLTQRIHSDSSKIVFLEYSIKQDGVRTEIKRKQAKNFTHDEKATFLLNRYSH